MTVPPPLHALTGGGQALSVSSAGTRGRRSSQEEQKFQLARIWSLERILGVLCMTNASWGKPLLSRPARKGGIGFLEQR